MTRALVRTGLLLILLGLSPVPATAAPSVKQAAFDAVVTRVKATMLTDPRASAEQAHDAEPLAAGIPDPKARSVALATAAWLQGEAFYRLGDLDRSMPLVSRALDLVRRADPGSKLEGDALLTSGSIHGSRTEVAAALADFQNAHRIFVAAGEKRSQAIALICLAMLYVDARDFTSAQRYLGEALEAYPADPGLAFAIYNSRGLAFQEQGRFDRAESDFKQALRFAHEAKATNIAAKYVRNIARNQLLAGHLAEADHTIAIARAAAGTSADDGKQLDAIAAQAALQHGHLQEAGQLIDRAFAGIDLARTDLPFRDSHRTAVAVYQRLHRPELALKHLEALKRLDDESTKLAVQTSTALMAARFDSANQDAKIARLRDAERLRKAREEVQRARTERTLWLGAAGATAIVIILLLIGIRKIRRSRDEVRAANDDLAVTNTALGKALAAKTEFLATTSHEIRTPLNGILGMTQVMLADSALAPTTRDRLTVVHGAGMTMRALVDDILDVAKMETGNLDLETAPFDLRTMLDEASRMWAEQARDKGLTFTVDLDRCPPRVEGDAARVRQIVFNLLSNALKFTTRGSVTLIAEQAGDGVRVVVTDTGIGIPLAQQEAVFESFRQADTSTTRQFGGTGLGLSICRNLVQAMGGELTLASKPGEGSSFTVVLPLKLLAALPAACDAPGGGETLLVLDRNPIARAMFRTLFAPHVETVVFAGSAEEADACLTAGKIDHVLIDDVTARAGGDPHGLVRAVVERAGDARVSLLWPAADGDQGELTALGLAQVIAKPVSGAALVDRLFAASRPAADHSPLVSRAA